MALFGLPNVERLKERRDVQGLLEASAHKDASTRRHAVVALGDIGNSKALARLIAALNDEDAGVRQASAEALGKLGQRGAVTPDVAVEPLVAFLRGTKKGEADLRETASLALARLGDDAVAALAGVLTDEKSRTYAREAAARTLSRIGGPEAERVLRKRVHWDAVRSGDLDSIIVALGDEDPLIRLDAARALGEFRDRAAVEALVGALEDPYRITVSQGKLRWANGGMELGKGLGKKTEYPVRDAAKEALVKIGTPSARRAAAEYAAREAEREADRLVSRLSDESASVRRLAAEELSKVAGPRTVPRLIRMLERKRLEADIAESVASALWRIGSSEARQAVLAYRRSNVKNTRGLPLP